MDKHIVSIGDLVLDIILPVTLPVEANHHQDPPERGVEPGGAGNFMIAARHMGLAVTAAGAVGSDLFGDTILAALRAEEIDTQFVVALPEATSTIVAALTDQASGEHTFVGNYGSGPEVPYPAGLDDCIADADAVYLQGYTLAEKRVVPMALRAIEQAIAMHVPVYLDVGPFMALVAREHIPWLVQHTHLMLMTEQEIPLIADGKTDRDAYDLLLAGGSVALVIKRGADGCEVVTSDHTEHIPGYLVPVVDTVGAGDCFDAAFIAGRLQGLSLADCARLANAMGAASVGRMGAGRNAPTCADILELLREAGDEVTYSC